MRRAELHLSVRITVAGVAAFALAELLSLPQGYWSVFTAVLVTQASVGGSLTAALDRFTGTLSGAAFSAAVAVTVPHGETVSLTAALAISLAPLAMLAAIKPTFRVAPVTAVIVLLGTAGTTEGPVLAAALRTLEVALGGLVGLVVSATVLPKRGHVLLFETADKILVLMAELLAKLFVGLTTQSKASEISAQHAKIQSLFERMKTAMDETHRERLAFPGEQLDLAPLPRTLRRVYHDLVHLGRVASRPLPGIDAGLALRASYEGEVFLKAMGAALLRRAPPPDFSPFENAARELSAQVPPGPQAGEDAGRRAALGFALGQMERDMRDLVERANEFARGHSQAT